MFRSSRVHNYLPERMEQRVEGICDDLSTILVNFLPNPAKCHKEEFQGITEWYVTVHIKNACIVDALLNAYMDFENTMNLIWYEHGPGYICFKIKTGSLTTAPQTAFKQEIEAIHGKLSQTLKEVILSEARQQIKGFRQPLFYTRSNVLDIINGDGPDAISAHVQNVGDQIDVELGLLRNATSYDHKNRILLGITRMVHSERNRNDDSNNTTRCLIL